MKLKLKIFGCDIELTGGFAIAAILLTPAMILELIALILKHYDH